MSVIFQAQMKVKVMTYRIIILLFLTVSLSAQIKPHIVFETGYEDRSMGVYVDNEFDGSYHLSSLYSKLEMSVKYKGFSIYSHNKTSYIPENVYAYNPKQVEFTIGSEYERKSFKIYYEHFCSHSIEMLYMSDSYDRIGIRIKIL